jgi:hypothetical protein
MWANNLSWASYGYLEYDLLFFDEENPNIEVKLEATDKAIGNIKFSHGKKIIY